MTFVWFSVVALMLSHTTIRSQFIKVQPKLEKAFGVILVALGIKIALASAK